MASRKKAKADQAVKAAQKRRTSSPVRRGPGAQTSQADRLVLQRAIANPAVASPADIQSLQRAYGNRAVTGLIQAKLTVGPVGDKYEQEADRVADQVMGMPTPVAAGQAGKGSQLAQRQAEEEEVQMKPARLGNGGLPLAASITPLVQRQEEEEEAQLKPLLQRQEEEEEVQMKPLLQRQEEEEEVQMKPHQEANGSFVASPGLESRLATRRGAGSALPDRVRSFMEPRFGADFSQVQVHADGESAQMNRELNSQAFTHGQDIYFKPGNYNPDSGTGKQLLAHELTHVIQQSGKSDRIARWGNPPSAVGWVKKLGKKGEEKEKVWHGPGTLHKIVTKQAFAELDSTYKVWYSPQAQDYLAEQSDKMDERGFFIFGAIIPGKIYGAAKGWGPGLAKAGRKIKRGAKRAGRAMKRGLGRGLGWMTRGKLGYTASEKRVEKWIDEFKADRERREDRIKAEEQAARWYDQLKTYWRPTSEAPNHAEGGLYQGDGSTQDRERVAQYITNATTAWKKGNPRQSLTILAYALHSAEDQGAHGHGRPGTGHDPRRSIPPPKGATQGHIYENYKAAHGGVPDDGFDCDRQEKNAAGFRYAVDRAQEVLSTFAIRIGAVGEMGEEKPLAESLPGGAGLAAWKKANRFKRKMRGAGRFFGGKDIIRL